MRHISVLLSLVYATNIQAGVFVNLYDSENKLKKSWARLFTMALNSGQSEAGIFRAFAKMPKDRINKAEKYDIKLGSIHAEQLGEFVIFRDEKTQHLVQVIGAYPDLVFILDNTVFTLPMTDKKALPKALDEMNKYFKKGVITAGYSEFSLLPAAEAGRGAWFLAGLILGSATAGGATLYRDTHSLESKRDTRSLEVLSRAQSRMAESLEEMSRIDRELANVTIPNETYALIRNMQSNTESTQLAKDLRGRLDSELERKYGAIYTPLLKTLRGHMDAETASVDACEARSEKIFSSIRSSQAPLTFEARRRALGREADLLEMQVGDVSFKTSLRPNNPVLPISAANQEVASAQVCRQGKCDKTGADTLADHIGLEIRRKSFGAYDTSPLTQLAQAISESAAQVREADTTCKEVGQIRGGGGIFSDKALNEFAEKKSKEDGGSNWKLGCVYSPQSIHELYQKYTSQNRLDRYRVIHDWWGYDSGWHSLGLRGCDKVVYHYLDSLPEKQLMADATREAAQNLPALAASCKKMKHDTEHLRELELHTSRLKTALDNYGRTLNEVTEPHKNREAYKALLFALNARLDVGWVCPRLPYDYSGRYSQSGSCYRKPLAPKFRELEDRLNTQIEDVRSKIQNVNENAIRISELSAVADSQALCCTSDYCKGKFELMRDTQKVMENERTIK